MHNSEGIPRAAINISSSNNNNEGILHPAAVEMTEAFSAKWHRAQEALMLGQHLQKWSYNKGRLALEFDEASTSKPTFIVSPQKWNRVRQEIADEIWWSIWSYTKA